MTARIRGLLCLLTVTGGALTAACTAVTDIPATTPCATTGAKRLDKVFGDNDSVVVGGTLDLFVLTSNTAGDPVCKLTINWAPATGDGTAAPTSSITSDVTDPVLQGTASTAWTVGTDTGVQTLVATVANSSPLLSATFTATVFPAGTCLAVRTIPVTDDFSVGDHWTATVLNTDGTASHSEANQSAGGNPGGYRQMTQVLGTPPGSSGTSNQTVLHLFTFFTYNPFLQGAICSVVYREDQISIGGADIGWGPAITQNGIVYTYHPTPSFNSPVWASKGPYSLVASDFSPAGLDFSENGAPVSFGFIRSGTTGLNPTQALTRMHGIDNWSFEIHGK